MDPTYPIHVVVEGITDEAVIRRVIETTKLSVTSIDIKHGRGELLRRLPKYNAAGRYYPWLVLTDLERDADCAPDFIQQVLPTPSTGMCFRLAVRAIESWLLADAEQLASFLQVPQSRIPKNPDAEDDPKVTLVNLARQSRKTTIRGDMVPREGSGGKVGPGYVGRVIEFAQLWRPEVAAERSDSLRRCLAALETLKTWKPD